MAGRVTVEARVKGSLKPAKRQIDQLSSSMRRARKDTTALAGGMGTLGTRLGFAAFQMTFLAGIAGRALGQIGNQFKELVQVSVKAEDTIVRAIAQSGIDISSAKSAKAVKFLNDAIRDLGGGRTIFSQQQVAESAKEIGRAFTFAGTDMEKAGQLALVLKANLRLMTIEQISAEESAIQLAKIMKQFGLNASEAMGAVNTLVLVNQQSSVTLQDLTKSMAAAGNFAREFGVDMNTLAAIMGVVSDRIGIRGSAAGRAFRRILENLSRTSTSLDPKLKALGISIRDNAGNMRNIIDILRDFRVALDKGGKAGSLVRQRILELGTASIRSRDALLALTQGFPQLQASLRGLEEGADTAERLEQIFTQTTSAKIDRLKFAINSLKQDLVAGLSPALTLILEDLRTLILDTGVQEFFTELGKTIGGELVPIIKVLSKLFGSLANTLKKNKVILQGLVKGLVIFLSVLAGLFIVATLGALIFGLSAGFQILAGSAIVARLASNALFISLLKFVLIIGLVVVAVSSFVKILRALKDGLQEADGPIIAFNALLVGLSVASLLAIAKFGLLKAAIAGIGASIVGTAAVTPAFKNAVGGLGAGGGAAFNTGFLGRIGGLPKGIAGIIGRLGTGSIIGLAIIAGSAIGIAIGLSIRQAIQEAKDFGFKDAGELMVSNFLLTVSQLAFTTLQWREDVLTNVAAVIDFFDQMRIDVFNMDWDALGAKINTMFDGVKQSIESVIDGLNAFGLAVKQPLIFQRNEALDRIRKALIKAREEGTFEVGVALDITTPVFKNIPGVEEALKGAAQAIEQGALTFDDIQMLVDSMVFSAEGYSEKVAKAGQLFLDQQQSQNSLQAILDSYTSTMGSAIDSLNGSNQVIEDAALTQENFKKELEASLEAKKEEIEAISNITLVSNEEVEAIQEKIEVLEQDIESINEEIISIDEATTAIDKNVEAIIEETESHIELTQIQKKLAAAAKRATEVFDSAKIQKELPAAVSTEEQQAKEVAVGTTQTIEGLKKLIQDALESGLSEIAIQPLVNQLHDLEAQLLAGVNTSLPEPTPELPITDPLIPQRLIDSIDRFKENLDATSDFSQESKVILEEFNKFKQEEIEILEATIELEKQVNEELQITAEKTMGMNEQIILAEEEMGIINERLIEIEAEFKKLKIDPKNIDVVNKTTAALKITEKNTLDMNREIKNLTGITRKIIVERIKQSASIIEEIKALIINTNTLDINTEIVKQDTKTVIDEILALAKNQGMLDGLSIAMGGAAAGLARFKVEMEEAARRVASLRVTKKGDFIIDPRDQEQVKKNLDVLKDSIKKASKVDLEEIRETLEEIIRKVELKAIEEFDSSKIQKGLADTVSNEELQKQLIEAGSTQTVEGLQKLIADSLESGLSGTEVSQLIKQLSALLAEQGVTIKGFQKGGIISKPTLAALAERGPEAVIPLDKLGGLGGDINTEVNITIEGTADNTTAEEIGETVMEIINENIRKANPIIRR